MGQDSQYNADLVRMAELVHHITAISKACAAAHMLENGVSRLYSSSYALVKTDVQYKKLSELFEFMSLFEAMRDREINHVIVNSESACEYFKNFYADKQDKEYFSAAFLDVNGNVLKTKIMGEGTLIEAPVYPREFLKEALFANSHSVIISHNHPGLSLRPSSADLEGTRIIAKALNTVDISLNDHILVTGRRAFSFAENGIDFGSIAADRYKLVKGSSVRISSR
jgi:DNA repair protein RadC